MIRRLSGWSSTTKMRLLMPFPPAARLRLHSRERADENAFETPPVPVSAMPLLHTLRVQRGVAQKLLSTCRLHLSLDNDREPEGKSRALARLRLDPDFAPVHLNNAFRYGKPQAGAALLSGDGVVNSITSYSLPGETVSVRHVAEPTYCFPCGFKHHPAQQKDAITISSCLCSDPSVSWQSHCPRGIRHRIAPTNCCMTNRAHSASCCGLSAFENRS